MPRRDGGGVMRDIGRRGLYPTILRAKMPARAEDGGAQLKQRKQRAQTQRAKGDASARRTRSAICKVANRKDDASGKR